MNIQNISQLADQLKRLGFADMGYVLAKRICFRPKTFCLSHRFEKGDYTLSFYLSFKRSGQSSDYILMFYDAALQKSALIEQSVVGIDVAKLSQQMSEIDWKMAFDFNERKNIGPGDKAVFEKEQIIENIIIELEALQATSQGKSIAALLKSSHWAGSAYHDIFGTLNGQKPKADISQRFYCVEGQPGITVDEAFRYLQNRWLEKEMLSRKKHTGEADKTTENAERGSGLLRKKRSRRSRLSKSEK